MLRKVSLIDESLENIIKSLNDRNEEVNASVEISVKDILGDIKENGDKALYKYTENFDKVKLDKLEVSKEELKECMELVNNEFICALKEASENIRKFHEKQKQNTWSMEDENNSIMGQRVLPLYRVGVYVPGGTAAYPSSVLMNVIPAKVAGVKEVIMVTPPSKDGRINPYIGVAAYIAGVDKVYTVGGAQAIGALAYGTETIRKVDKIVGPGNIFVATAKKLVYGSVDIDMIAGPSEILVIGEEGVNTKFLAADLLSQAEHDKLASSILVTTSEKLVDEVCSNIKEMTIKLERKEIIESSLKSFGMAIICNSLEQCIEVANYIAPEHLELMVKKPFDFLPMVKNAGSVFLGEYSPEPVGDYFGGPNHVLPTSGTAKFFSALSVDSFVKKSSFLYYSQKALMINGNKIIELAEKEGLTAHANSVKVRLEVNEGSKFVH